MLLPIDPRCASALTRRIAGRHVATYVEEKGRELSKGLRQRLMLCMALVSAPQILFLDEPTSGLDDRTRMIREVIARMNR